MSKTLDIKNTVEDKKKSNIPSIIKYMGSKKPILNFILSNIKDIHISGNSVCDLFSGSCTISAALRKDMNFISNDIQEYSEILGKTYFSDLSRYNIEKLLLDIEKDAKEHVAYFKNNFSEYFYDYSSIKDLKKYQRIELKQRDLFQSLTFNTDYFLFVKYYSGTYWSFEQCVWLDSLRKTTEKYKDETIYYALLSSIMYAMSYSTQSTGHFAQYRDGNTLEAMNNIIIYRLKNIYDLFSRKIRELVGCLDNSLKNISTMTLSFEDCLKVIPAKTTVYADPPYAPVHYSRFYHVLETLVKYDYPTLLHKGRYREDRHQSPFSQKSKALGAFKKLFSGIVGADAQMILSYSGSGVVTIDSIMILAKEIFKSNIYYLESKEVNHQHSTMGRFEDQKRDVIEYLIIAKFK